MKLLKGTGQRLADGRAGTSVEQPCMPVIAAIRLAPQSSTKTSMDAVFRIFLRFLFSYILKTPRNRVGF